MAAQSDLYLFIHCDGWVRFGPFKSLEYDAERGAIVDQAGRSVASLQPGTRHWTIPGDKWVGFGSNSWIITTSATLPRPSIAPELP